MKLLVLCIALNTFAAEISEKDKLLWQFRAFSRDFQANIALFFEPDSKIKQSDIDALFLKLLTFFIKAHDTNNEEILKALDDLFCLIETDLMNISSINEECVEILSSVDQQLKNFDANKYLSHLLTDKRVLIKLSKQDRKLLKQPDPKKHYDIQLSKQNES